MRDSYRERQTFVYEVICNGNSAILQGKKPGVSPSYKSVILYDTFPKLYQLMM